MAKVTSKYQVTVPRAIAERYEIHPGDHLDWVAAGDVIQVVPRGKQVVADDRQFRLRLFDEATERQRKRASAGKLLEPSRKGWTRDDLHRRGRSR